MLRKCWLAMLPSATASSGEGALGNFTANFWKDPTSKMLRNCYVAAFEEGVFVTVVWVTPSLSCKQT